MFFGTIVLLIVPMAIFAPSLAPFDPYKESVVLRLKPWGYRGHTLGTDELGRDLLSRLIYGARSSPLMGLVPVAIATILGGTQGGIGGYAGRRVHAVIKRTMDVFYAFHSVLLAVAISGAMGGGMVNGMTALALVFIPAMCRVAETALPLWTHSTTHAFSRQLDLKRCPDQLPRCNLSTWQNRGNDAAD